MDVPYREHDLSTKVIYRSIPIIDPDQLLAYLWDEVGIEIPDHTVEKYWRETLASDIPWVQYLPAGVSSKTIPLKLSGDDCSYNLQGDKCLAWVLSSPLWRPLSGRNSRWPMAIISLKNHLGPLSMRPILMRIVQQLNRCWDEKTCSGHHFIVTEIGGDWKYVREVFEMRTHWNSVKLCHLCRTPRSCITTLADDLPEGSRQLL